ncbi:MAG TPA: serine hydrolase [Gemmatimonadales bacterium]|nr:serine hydrolase [Gemmatimonadales bacterium]
MPLRLVALVALTPIAALAQEPVGLWGAEIVAPHLSGELTVTRDGTAWSATIAGHELGTEGSQDSVWVGERTRGGFIGRIRSDGALQGFWIQAPGLMTDAPYASPLVLERTGAAQWRGNVVPLEDQLTLFLDITSDSAQLRAVFRNPEANLRPGGAPEFAVRRSGNDLSFRNPTSGSVTFIGRLDAVQRTITLNYPPLPDTITLTARDRATAVGFVPRASGNPYTYRPPPPGDDGWRTAAARDVGMDEQRLAHLIQRVIDTNPAAHAAPLIHSILVARRGKLVLEEYFYGFTADRPHALRSASKTFASILAGELLLRPEMPVYPVFRSYGAFANPDPRKSRITLGQLFTHSTGLACDDNDAASPGNENTMQSQTKEPDWYKYTLDLPVIHDPGSLYAYCSATLNLAGGVLEAASRTWLPELFRREIAEPLGITHWYMNLMPTGHGYAGGGMYLRPRDLLKIGQLYLDLGVWNGRRIVPKRWVEQSTDRQIATSNGGSDGYAWHRYMLHTGTRDYKEYEANGNGGQLLMVVPELDMVIVFTAGNYNQYGVWRKFREELVPEGIIGAVK